MSNIFTYSTIDDIELKAEFLPAKDLIKGKTLIYIHGGGFIVGERSDLPNIYIEMLNEAGYHLLLLDYPLAPEVDLTAIKSCLNDALDWFENNYQTKLALTNGEYLLFGRSAGAYMSLLLTAQRRSQLQKGLVAFYGYYSLLLKELQQPNHYYDQFPRSSFMTLYGLTESGIKTHAPIRERYPLYIHYRQTGDWLMKILPDRTLWESYSLTDSDLSQLPPTFITASDADKDVPYSCTLHLAQMIPNNNFYPVHGLFHDFDRDTDNPISIDIYHKLIDWLDKL